jgi:hypothetical protein
MARFYRYGRAKAERAARACKDIDLHAMQLLQVD